MAFFLHRNCLYRWIEKSADGVKVLPEFIDTQAKSFYAGHDDDSFIIRNDRKKKDNSTIF